MLPPIVPTFLDDGQSFVVEFRSGDGRVWYFGRSAMQIILKSLRAALELRTEKLRFFSLNVLSAEQLRW